MPDKLKLLLVAIITVLAILAALFFTQNKKAQNSKGSQVPVSASQAAKPMTLEDIQTSISENFNSKNFAKMEEIMQKPNVQVTIQSTECCSSVTSSQASSMLSYVQKGIPMDFNQKNPTIVTLKSKHPELKSAYVGISKNDTQLVAFSLNKNSEISAITMAVSWKIFDFSAQQPSPSPTSSSHL